MGTLLGVHPIVPWDWIPREIVWSSGFFMYSRKAEEPFAEEATDSEVGPSWPWLV